MTGRSEPVEIPGLVAERLLGSGGYADVHLYRQVLPERPVAVKILRDPVDDPAVRARFERETNLMAALSAHPSIVTVHAAAIAGNGRPYIVMEYCSRPNLAEACAQRPPSVPEALQTLIRLAGAIETAHRAGILHRDIKPANVLTTDYGWPALTDFGISALVGGGDADEGISVPWAAPEAVSGRGFDARSDVYGLAATAYTILAGRAPFDLPTRPSSLSELVTRVLSAPVPPLERDDLPPALERLITAALAKRPDDRPQTISEFARSLQRIELDLNLPMTHLDVPAAPLAHDEIGDRTELASRRGAGAAARADEHTVLSPRRSARTEALPADDEADERTMLSSHRSAPPADAEADDATMLSPRRSPPEEHPEVDDATRLVDRGPRAASTAEPTVAPAAEDAPLEGTVLSPRAPQPAPADDPDDATAFVRRPRDPGLVRGRVDTPRQAVVPGRTDAAERYGIRADAAPAPITRAPLAPPTPETRPSARTRRTRGAGMVVAVIGGVVVVVGAAATVVMMIIGGGA